MGSSFSVKSYLLYWFGTVSHRMYLFITDILMEQMKIAEMKQIIEKLASHKDDMVKTQVKDMKAIFDKG